MIWAGVNTIPAMSLEVLDWVKGLEKLRRRTVIPVGHSWLDISVHLLM